MTVVLVDKSRTRELRRAVLRPGLPSDAALPGDDLSDGVHLAVLDGEGTALCTCFIYPDPCPWVPDRAGAWHLRQMATAEGFRRRGMGAAVVDAASEYAAAQHASLLWCNARERAVPFYRRCGFLAHGALFVDDDHWIPHQRMWRELSPRPGASNG